MTDAVTFAERSEISGKSSGVLITYGTCHVAHGAEGGCTPPFEVQTRPPTAIPWSRVSGCSRLAPVRGVPVVNLGGGLRGVLADAVVAIDSGSINIVGTDAVDALRQVGQTDAMGLLPPPPASIVRQIDAACGAHPGDHGPGGQ